MGTLCSEICGIIKQNESHVGSVPKWVLDMVVMKIHRVFINWKPHVSMTFCYKVSINYLHDIPIRYRKGILYNVCISRGQLFSTFNSFCVIVSHILLCINWVLSLCVTLILTLTLTAYANTCIDLKSQININTSLNFTL